jgi:hypothetical protein
MTAAQQPEENRIKPLSWPEGAELVLENPYDFKPALDALMEKVTEVRATLPDKKIVIVFGEEHDLYAHQRFKAEFVKALAGDHPEQIAYGEELPSDYGRFTGEEMATDMVEEREAYRAWQRGVYLDRPWNSYRDTLSIELTRKLSISMCMNDVARVVFSPPPEEGAPEIIDEPTYCDLSHKETYDFIKGLYDEMPDQKELIRCSYPDAAPMQEGVRISNGFMAKEITRHIRDTGVQTYVQSCGAAHLIGFFGDGWEQEYGDSLTCKLLHEGHAVIPVLLFDQITEGEYTIPSEGLEALRDNVVMIRRLRQDMCEDVTPEEEARYDAAMGPLF